jgi:hypothetical protein
MHEYNLNYIHMKRLTQTYCDPRLALLRGNLLLSLGLIFFFSAQGQSVYTFEHLTIHQTIDGHDNWVDKPGQGYAWVYQDESAVNGTKVIQPVPTVIFNQSAFLTRVNDSLFHFLPFSGEETEATMQFDLRGDHIALFALGYDWNGDGKLEADSGEIGPVFGSDDQHFVMQATGGDSVYMEPFGPGNSRHDWYRIQLRINFLANGGQGAGSLYYLNLSDGDQSYQAVTGLQNINLQLNNLHPQATPDNWNAMWLHLLAGGGNEPAVDNLIPNLATAATGIEVQEAETFSFLGPNYPNPFSAVTHIPFSLTRTSKVSLVVLDGQGRLVRNLKQDYLVPGDYNIEMDGSALPAGIYLYQIRTEYFSETRKMVILR